MSINRVSFGKLRDGREASLFQLRNANGVEVNISDFGGAIVGIRAPDRSGRFGDVVLGFDGVGAYEADDRYFGVIVGRCANRIANSRIVLDGLEYRLAQNEDSNHLHGGIQGFGKKLWQVEEFGERIKGAHLMLEYVSSDGEEGYPGTVSCVVHFVLDNSNTLRIDYVCTTNKTTVVNLTHHPYFNLKDGGRSSAMEHQLKINAEHYLPMDEDKIVTGDKATVSKGPRDFRASIKIDERLGDLGEQRNNGFNEFYVLEKVCDRVSAAATLTDPCTGRVVEVSTSQPGILFYSGGYIGKETSGRNGSKYKDGYGVCLEPQNLYTTEVSGVLPDTQLEPGQVYRQTTEFRFLVDR